MVEGGRILWTEQPPTENKRMCFGTLVSEPASEHKAAWKASQLPGPDVPDDTSRTRSPPLMIEVTRVPVSQASTKGSSKPAQSGSRQ